MSCVKGSNGEHRSQSPLFTHAFLKPQKHLKLMFSGTHTVGCNAKKNNNNNVLKITFFKNASPITTISTEQYLHP